MPNGVFASGTRLCRSDRRVTGLECSTWIYNALVREEGLKPERTCFGSCCCVNCLISTSLCLSICQQQFVIRSGLGPWKLVASNFDVINRAICKASWFVSFLISDMDRKKDVQGCIKLCKWTKCFMFPSRRKGIQESQTYGRSWPTRMIFTKLLPRKKLHFG